MPDDKNFTRWHFGSQASKDRIIVELMDEVAELKREKAERDSKKGVPETLQFLARKSKMPKIIS